MKLSRSASNAAASTTPSANYLAALWESRGDKVRASILRAIRDRKLAEIVQIPPPKDTII